MEKKEMYLNTTPDSNDMWKEFGGNYETAEQECLDNDGEVTTDFEWKPICIIYVDEWCYLEDIENWECEWLHEWWWERITVVTDLCNEEWWEIQDWEDQELCVFDDGSFCYINDLVVDSCHKWDMVY